MNKFILTLLIFFAIIFTCSSQNISNPNVRDHVRLQKEMSYENRIKENSAFTKKSARYSNKVKKQKARKERKRNKRNNKFKSISKKE